MTATGNCEYRMGDGKVCGVPTNTSFGFGRRNYFYCEAHKDQLYEKVTGKKPKIAKPK
jgi:hypothetical protein